MAGHQFRYVVDRKTWHCWNGRYHLADRSGFMHKVVQSFANTYQDAIHPIEKEVKNTAECQALWATEVLKKKGKPEIDAVKVMQEWMTQIKKRALWHLSPQFKYGRALLNDPVQERISRQLAKKLGTDGSEYDQDKALVNFSNGTFELARTAGPGAASGALPRAPLRGHADQLP